MMKRVRARARRSERKKMRERTLASELTRVKGRAQKYGSLSAH
jgi:hypothetical protein